MSEGTEKSAASRNVEKVRKMLAYAENEYHILCWPMPFRAITSHDYFVHVVLLCPTYSNPLTSERTYALISISKRRNGTMRRPKSATVPLNRGANPVSISLQANALSSRSVMDDDGILPAHSFHLTLTLFFFFFIHHAHGACRQLTAGFSGESQYSSLMKSHVEKNRRSAPTSLPLVPNSKQTRVHHDERCRGFVYSHAFA